MLPKYFTITLVLTFYLISPESRDLLGFIVKLLVYNIMLLMFILTPGFSSPI